MLKEQIATSVHVETDDLDYTPFDAKGGRGKMWQLFGEEKNKQCTTTNSFRTTTHRFRNWISSFCLRQNRRKHQHQSASVL